MEELYDDDYEYEYTTMPLIGDKAPAFQAITTNGMVNFPDDYKGKWVILFSHPSDFTPVCTTEFMTFASMQEEFRDKYDCSLLGLSIDSVHAHIAWLRKINTMEWKHYKNLEVKYPVIADISMEVANKYGMIHSQSSTATVRAVFFIDPKGVIRTVLYYPASLGRSFVEIKRILAGLQKADAEGCATPADWQPGDDVIIPAPNTNKAARERMEDSVGPDFYCLDWFLCFQKDDK